MGPFRGTRNGTTAAVWGVVDLLWACSSSASRLESLGGASRRRGRWDENEGTAPTRPDAPEPDPEEPVMVLQAHRSLLSLKDYQLSGDPREAWARRDSRSEDHGRTHGHRARCRVVRFCESLAYRSWRVPTASGSTTPSPNAVTSACMARQPVQWPAMMVFRPNSWSSATV